MYDAPFGVPVAAGWVLAGAVAVLLGLRALRVEARARPDAAPRSAAVRLLDVGLDVVLALAVAVLLATLVLVVVLAQGPA